MNLLAPVTLSLEAQVRALRERAGALLLDHVAVLAVGGPDRAAWLNGMVTNDVRELRPGRGVYAAAVTVKGRIIADFFVHPRADDFLLVVSRARADDLAAHLDRFIVMEDVTVARVAASVVSVQGPEAEALGRQLGQGFLADRLGRGGIDLVVAEGDADALRPRLAALAATGALATVDAEAWEVARLEAGVPAFGTDFDVTNFVQEAAITPRAVSFHKGCYVGQETVCRLEMRGHVQKLLTALLLDGDPPPRGTAVTVDDKPVGTVTSSARSASLPGRSVALAMVKHAVVEAATPVTVAGVAAVISPRPVA